MWRRQCSSHSTKQCPTAVYSVRISSKVPRDETTPSLVQLDAVLNQYQAGDLNIQLSADRSEYLQSRDSCITDTNMNSAGAAPEKTIFYVGHHETRREYEISEEVLHHAQDLNVRIRRDT